MIIFTPIYVFSIYVFIYLLLPLFLQKRKYLLFIGAAFITAFCNFIGSFYLSVLLFKIFNINLPGREIFFAPLRLGFYQGIVLTLSASGLVMGVKFAKGWYVQQIENTKLERLKNESEIRLLKNHIRPVFLFRYLNALHKRIITKSKDSAEMLLQLSELLSYFLYDSKDELVPLQKELDTFKLLIELEKMNSEDNAILKLYITGNCEKKYISPLQLFSHIQDILYDAGKKEGNYNCINIRVGIEDHLLDYSLSGDLILNTQIILYDSVQSNLGMN